MPERVTAADPGRDAAEGLFLAWCQRQAEGRAEPFSELLEAHPEHRARLVEMNAAFDEFRSVVDAADPGGMLQRALGEAEEVTGSGTSRSEELVEGLAGGADSRARYVPGRLLAQGGMGTILKARDRTLRRDVALKLLESHGTDAPETARARFLAEAYVTGRLDHPGIVPVHDLGLDARGRLFFTMKLVNGITFREALERIARSEDGWTLNRGVGVLSRVCEAVAYAHSKGVLHRDIKPANIMVGAYGETYLMDWGLARVLAREGEPPPETPSDELAPLTAEDLQQLVAAAPSDQPALPDTWLLTQDGKILGTPVYMSPEQARGEVDHVDERSDIWSLGAILHHLITGRLPWVEEGERPLPLAVLLRVRQGGLPPASRLAPDAPPTLLAICERALAERPEERYRDAEQMAAALRDYLEDISEAREEARRQEARARGAFDFLVGMLASGDPAEARGRDVTVREVLDRAAERLRREPPRSPLDEANLRGVLGRLFKELGRYEEAAEHLEAAVARFEEVLGAHHPDTLHAAADLALVWRRMGRTDEAESLLRNTLEAQRTTLGDNHPDTLRSLHLLAAQLHRVRGERVEAEKLYREAFEGRRLTLGASHVDTLITQNSLAMITADGGRLDDGVALMEDAASHLVEQLGEDHPAVLIARGDLAKLYLRLADPQHLAMAEDLFRRVLAVQERVVGPAHPDALIVRNNLGMVLLLRGQPAAALAELTTAADGYAAALGEGHARTITFRANIGLALLDLASPTQAEPVLRAAIERATGNPTVTPLSLGRFHRNLGRCLRALERRDDARREFEAARELYTAARLDADHAWFREINLEIEACRPSAG